MSSIPTFNPVSQGLNAQDTRIAGRHAHLRHAAHHDADASAPATDSVELSSQAIEQSLKFEAPSRDELIARIKAQIADGSYGEDDKLAIVADRLVNELNK